jgi:hypothetical protein
VGAVLDELLVDRVILVDLLPAVSSKNRISDAL